MKIIIEPEPTVSCSNCVGACCRAPTMVRLTHPEAEFLEAGGTELNPVVGAQEAEELRQYEGRDLAMLNRKIIATVIPEGFGYYEILGACGYLALDPSTGVGICTVFSQPERPLACAEFEVGSEDCTYFRKGYGLPT